ncbi:response regulator transcription factor [Evansella sp. LMS18]|jgi:DNA-binding response OmpR family regulator|uniref:response regulator transcription factor n=1 Tax=Evansella sp. LMS18 TaxID=2924033 RepID=UPI0020CFEB92|nr:response regulator transcription factor [Evansella sp. LMS18]UTR08641.1 response regulator transcription factor [Evansella sp. LMS18]
MNNPLKVLIIEDDPSIIDLIQMYIEKQGFTAITASRGDEGIQKFYDGNPDFVILDIMLPEMDGWEVCKMIRLEDQKVPVIMLTGKGESYDKIKGLEIGADDYIVKPFDPNELVARVKAVLRRSNVFYDTQKMIELPRLSIDMNEHKVFVDTKEVLMPPKELELLCFFANHPNRVFTRQQLLDQIWGYDYEGDPRTIDVHVKRLREKLKDHSPDWSLKTIRGVGYKFEVISFR